MGMDRIKAVSEQIVSRLPAVRGKGEEATKQALVLPMLDALGYDIWHPGEVCPEYEADFATKKAAQKEKVDIAILIGGVPRIYLEVKSIDTGLDGHEGQLARYFNATPSVTLGALTNGVEWRFFTDTGDPNVLDAEPFHVARLDAADQGLEVLARFAKAVFSAEAIRDYATELRYTAKIADFLRTEIDLREREPSDLLVRWILKSEGMYEGVVNANVVERFRPIAKAALMRVFREVVRRSIAAMDDGVAKAAAVPAQDSKPSAADQERVEDVPEGLEELPPDDDERPAVDTTEDELKFFAGVKGQFERSSLCNSTVWDAGARKELPASVVYKDTINYFSVYLNRPSWWVMRVSLRGRKPWLAFNIDPEQGRELLPEGFTLLSPYPWATFRVLITGPDDIERLNRLVFAAFQRIVDEKQKHQQGDEAKGEDGGGTGGEDA